ncbi:hypothetical protein [Streptosporangium lutulentum]|uniref:Uncharacterized protein n=1 Tax=Streptosporangium lutulentum TaxID=1461250 RepID=A0ABT9QU81_9ACTN|nr:hypothetical protein [Streptosporangium lutulentum]MDP9850316.1 hypothetical protein [Streptosporangium lutulentum]
MRVHIVFQPGHLPHVQDPPPRSSQVRLSRPGNRELIVCNCCGATRTIEIGSQAAQSATGSDAIARAIRHTLTTATGAVTSGAAS